MHPNSEVLTAGPITAGAWRHHSGGRARQLGAQPCPECATIIQGMPS